MARKRLGKNKCTICGKGFNAKSHFVTCHACDKLTHIRCVQNSYDEEQYLCINCEPSEEHEHSGDTILDAIAQEMIPPEDEDYVIVEEIIEENISGN